MSTMSSMSTISTMSVGSARAKSGLEKLERKCERCGYAVEEVVSGNSREVRMNDELMYTAAMAWVGTDSHK